MAAIPAGVSEWGGTAPGETVGETETETETEGGREGQQGGGQSDREEGRGGPGAEVSAVVGRRRRRVWMDRGWRLLVSAGTWAWP